MKSEKSVIDEMRKLGNDHRDLEGQRMARIGPQAPIGMVIARDAGADALMNVQAGARVTTQTICFNN